MTSEETDHCRRVALARVTKAAENLLDGKGELLEAVRDLRRDAEFARATLDDWPRNTRLAGAVGKEATPSLAPVVERVKCPDCFANARGVRRCEGCEYAPFNEADCNSHDCPPCPTCHGAGTAPKSEARHD